MRGNERLTGLQDDPEQGVTENASGEADKKGKGKSKEESHVDVYRLFVTSVWNFLYCPIWEVLSTRKMIVSSKASWIAWDLSSGRAGVFQGAITSSEYLL